MFRTGLTFDVRAPDFGAPRSEIFKAALDMCAFGDEVGMDALLFPEHHGTEDGYNPCPTLMAAAAASRTKRISIIVGAIVLPLHDPVEIAEQIAVLDNISGGRLYATLVGGYVQREFNMFGKSLNDRAKRMDEGLEVIVRALSGERFTYQGREIFVRPLPVRNPPRILVGGGVPAAARRAAKYHLGLWVLQPELVSESHQLIELYKAECRKNGVPPGPIMSTPPWIHVARDPEEGWRQIGEHVLHTVQSYASWADDRNTKSSPFFGKPSVEAIRASGYISVLTPEEAVAFARQKKHIALVPLISGLDPKIGWKMLELFASEVLPKLKEG
jgi:alkanesulfonate monooxygenase SsuD/methylene tetrahydromethanopterin reductase-like flavin-dependent oxidoreductase (luciferase family)